MLLLAFVYDHQFRVLSEIVKLAGAEDTGVVSYLVLQLEHETVVAIGLHSGNQGSYIHIHEIEHGLVCMRNFYPAGCFCSRLVGPVDGAGIPVAGNTADVQGVVRASVWMYQVAIVRLRIGVDAQLSRNDVCSGWYSAHVKF